MAELKVVGKSGFFNSLNDDRLYTAEDMNKPYSRLVADGVFATSIGNPSSDLQVNAFSNMLRVGVRSGQGIFGGKWFELTNDVVFDVPNNPNPTTRYDSVFIQVNNNLTERKTYVIYRTGTTVAPPLSNDPNVVEYRLGNVIVPANAVADMFQGYTTTLAVDDLRGTSAGTPWVMALIQQPDTSTLLDAYRATYYGWLNTAQANFTQWENNNHEEFASWFDSIQQTLATATLIRSYNSSYVTSVHDERNIPINITQFNKNIDILQVYVSGLLLVKDVEYTVLNNTTIQLTNGVSANTRVSFVVYKSIDGSDAETVVSQVYELQNELTISKITNSTGSVKLSALSGADVLQTFLNAGKGFHTMYIQNGSTNSPASGAFRAFGHLTGVEEGQETGWIMAIQANGSVYANYLNNGLWQGWKCLYNDEPQPLYFTANGAFPNNEVAVVPTKPLSECQHGWELVFTGYDDTNNAPKDYYTQTVTVPKKSYKNAEWNGESVIFPLTYAYTASSNSMSQCAKVFTVYDDRLVSGTSNSTGASRNMVLRAIYEY